jgi:hypothetical protein
MSEIEAAGKPTNNFIVFLSWANAEVTGTLSTRGVATSLRAKRRILKLFMKVSDHFSIV